MLAKPILAFLKGIIMKLFNIIAYLIVRSTGTPDSVTEFKDGRIEKFYFYFAPFDWGCWIEATFFK